MKNIIKNVKNILLLKKIVFILLISCLVAVVSNLIWLFLDASPIGKIACAIFIASFLGLYIILRQILFDLPRHFYKKAQIDRITQEAINTATGPAPWYWKTFPSLKSKSKNKYIWTYRGGRGKHAYLVTLGTQNDEKNIKAVLNTYTRAFFIPPYYLGLWFVEKGEIKLVCFDPDRMPGFTLEDIPLEFRKSKEAFYSLATPVSVVTIPHSLSEGLHNYWFPPEFSSLEEIFAVIPYKGEGGAAYAIFELHPKTGDVKVMPQKWFTKESFDLGYEWITRVIRDPQSGKLYGDGIRIGIFELSDDGCQLIRWIGVS